MRTWFRRAIAIDYYENERPKNKNKHTRMEYSEYFWKYSIRYTSNTFKKYFIRKKNPPIFNNSSNIFLNVGQVADCNLHSVRRKNWSRQTCVCFSNDGQWRITVAFLWNFITGTPFLLLDYFQQPIDIVHRSKDRGMCVQNILLHGTCANVKIVSKTVNFKTANFINKSSVDWNNCDVHKLRNTFYQIL